METIVAIRDLRKAYGTGLVALDGVTLDIRKDEILALLGPNGAGKTTLISTICGIVQPTAGSVTVAGHDIHRDWRTARGLIGLVPQDIELEPFETVWNAVAYSRGLAGKPRNPNRLEQILRQLSLWDKKDSKTMELSGGMKRRALIAKALGRDPQVLFLDEPSAGVDVELRRDMWKVVGELRDSGVTIILTTHYIEEAEAIADRVAVINKGRILLVEDKTTLMERMGQKVLNVQLAAPLPAIPAALARDGLTLGSDGWRLSYAYDAKDQRTGITALLSALREADIGFVDLDTEQSSLEDIFLGLVKESA